MLLLEDKLSKTINAIEKAGIPCEFGIHEDDDYSYSLETLGDAVWGECNAEYANGVSKCAFIIPGCSEVVKVPFNGMMIYKCDYDEDLGEYLDGEDIFEEFTGADNSENDWDYCRKEYEGYLKAVEAGMEMFFAKTAFYGMVDNHPVYTQERVNTVDCGNGSSIRPTAESILLSRYLPNTKICNNKWLINAIECYGFTKVCSFLIFIRDNQIDSDLHDGNIGYREDGSPVLLDWAGWRH